MAGSKSVRQDVVASRRVGVRCLAVVVGVAIAGLIAGPVAMAQVPGLPGVPGLPDVPSVPNLPPEVQDAIETAEDTLIPILVDAAVQGQAVSNAVGFGLRPACAGAGTAVLLLVIAGGSLPVSPGFVVTPLLIFCAAAFSPGPADPAFETVDGAVGPTLSSNVEPYLEQVDAALTPYRLDYAPACGVLALAGSTPRQVPPPLNRFDLVNTVC
jgi:hypothetical protein